MKAQPPRSPLPVRARDQIRLALLTWYRQGHRDLPWRRSADPYAVWLSEIMLQQTRVETVKEYFRRFMERFPTPAALGAAPLDEVLTLWSGLGYYARARNLHAAARELVARYGGQFPRDAEAVRALPGVGDYTAGAIRSIAFGQQAAIVDGNVIRVLSRLFAINDPVDTTATRRRLWALAEELVPPPQAGPGGQGLNDPGDFNQALMELGAVVCTPQRPSCLVCPLRDLCEARALGSPEAFPQKRPPREVPTVQVGTLLLSHRGRVLLLRRAPQGLWGGLWEPPTGALREGEARPAPRLVKELLGLQLRSRGPAPRALPPFEHVLTHRRMCFQPFLIDLDDQGPAPELTLRGGYEQARWIDPGEPQALGLAAWVSNLLARFPASRLGA